MVSICIPVLNCRDYIEAAVLSADRQSFGDYEIVCVDNSSTDGTYEILEALEKKVQRLRLFRNDRTITMYENFNLGNKKAKGKYVKYLCADDLLHPDCLRLYVEPFERNPTIGLVTSRDHRIDELGRTISSNHPLRGTQTLSGRTVIRRMFRSVSGMYTSSPTHCMIRRDGGTFTYQRADGWGVETFKWLEVLAQADYHFIDRDLVSNRRHSRSAHLVTSVGKGTAQGYYDYFMTFYVDHKDLFTWYDLLLFKRNLMRILKQEEHSLQDLRDWVCLF